MSFYISFEKFVASIIFTFKHKNLLLFEVPDAWRTVRRIMSTAQTRCNERSAVRESHQLWVHNELTTPRY